MLRNRLAVTLLVLAACGGRSKSSDNTIPESKLTPDPPGDPAPAEAAPATPPAPAEPQTPPAPMKLEPVSLTLDAVQATVKLTKPGTGKRAPLRLAPAAGAKQEIDLVMEAVIEQAPAGAAAEKVVMPQVVLGGTSEVKTLGSDGLITYHTAITATDARDAAGQTVPPEAIEKQLASINTMVIDGTLSAASLPGTATYHVPTPDPSTAGALDSLHLMLPNWVPLPSEPVALGAQWQVTQPVVINSIATTQVTTYTLRGRSGTVATIAGDIKVTGEQQSLGEVTVSDIGGQGTVELVVDTAKLYPRMKRSVTTTMRLRQGAEDVTVTMQLGSAFQPR